MKHLFVVAVLLLAAFVGLGFYLSRTGTDDKTNLTITLNQEKTKEGKERVQEKVQELGRVPKEIASTPTSKGKEVSFNR